MKIDIFQKLINSKWWWKWQIVCVKSGLSAALTASRSEPKAVSSGFCRISQLALASQISVMAAKVQFFFKLTQKINNFTILPSKLHCRRRRFLTEIALTFISWKKHEWFNSEILLCKIMCFFVMAVIFIRQ